MDVSLSYQCFSFPFPSCPRVPLSPHPRQPLFVDLLMVAVPAGMKGYLIVLSIGISVTISDAGHLSLYMFKLIQFHSYVESSEQNKLTKYKSSHRYREQTDSCHRQGCWGLRGKRRRD